MAIELCVNNNFRLLAGAERVRMTEADLIAAALVPNPTLLADAQLIPLQRADRENQLGPPQVDASLSIPVDWLLFGKRVAAMRAAQLNIEVSSAEFADVLRLQLARTVDAFYEVLGAEGFLKLAEENHEELKKLEPLLQGLAGMGKAGSLDLDRLKLALLEAFLEIHARELALAAAKARLRPLIGRSARDPDFELEGVLTVKAVIPAPKLAEVVALAEAHRPDLLSSQQAIAHADALVEWERRRGKPQVAIVPGYTYQDQRHITGFRNGSLFGIGISTTLPFTDRNQGNIRKAQAQVRDRQFTYLGDRADALAEVETTLAEYEDAVEDVTQNNTAGTLKAAHDLRTKMEAAFRTGDRKLIDMLNTQQAYRERLAHVVDFESNYWRKLNKLNMVVGLKAYDPEKSPTQPLDKEDKKK